MSAGCTCPSGDGSLRWPCPVHPAADERRSQPVDASGIKTWQERAQIMFGDEWESVGSLEVYKDAEIADLRVALAAKGQQEPVAGGRLPHTVVSEALGWLDAALNCKEFHWDGDQRECAQWALDQSQKSLAAPVAQQSEAGAPADTSLLRATVERERALAKAGFALTAELLGIDGPTIKGVDYLPRNAVMDKVVAWRTAFDAAPKVDQNAIRAALVEAGAPTAAHYECRKRHENGMLLEWEPLDVATDEEAALYMNHGERGEWRKVVPTSGRESAAPGATPQVDALMAKWDDDGATRGPAFCDLRDLAREMERMLGELTNEPRS